MHDNMWDVFVLFFLLLREFRLLRVLLDNFRVFFGQVFIIWYPYLQSFLLALILSDFLDPISELIRLLFPLFSSPTVLESSTPTAHVLNLLLIPCRKSLGVVVAPGVPPPGHVVTRYPDV